MSGDESSVYSGSGEVICITCALTIEDPKYAKCDSCSWPQHYICAKLSTTEQRCLESKTRRRVKFYCEDCEKGLRVLPEVLSTLSSLKAEILLLKDEKSKQIRDNSPLLDQVNQPLQIEQCMEEYANRQQKMKNVISHNVEESTQNTANNRQEEDKTAASEVLASFMEKPPRIIRATRLGKKDREKIRSLRIVLEDSSIALDILKQRHSYNGPVQFSSDKTLIQRNHLKQLKAEVIRLNSTEGVPQKIIKYINGFPKIINASIQNDQNAPKNSKDEKKMTKQPTKTPKSSSTTKM